MKNGIIVIAKIEKIKEKNWRTKKGMTFEMWVVYRQGRWDAILSLLFYYFMLSLPVNVTSAKIPWSSNPWPLRLKTKHDNSFWLISSFDFPNILIYINHKDKIINYGMEQILLVRELFLFFVFLKGGKNIYFWIPLFGVGNIKK